VQNVLNLYAQHTPHYVLSRITPRRDGSMPRLLSAEESLLRH
jgi:hypothetical protein